MQHSTAAVTFDNSYRKWRNFDVVVKRMARDRPSKI